MDFPWPTSQRQLQRFIGLVNFYHRFIPRGAELLNSKSKFQKLTWNEEATAAFMATKEALANATLLYYPKPDAPTCLMMAASNTAVGAVLQQYVDGMWHLISFSKKMKPAETHYSTFDRELLAVYLAIQHFQHFLQGRQFHVLTDHKPLTFALQAHPDWHSPRQARQLDFTSQFTSNIRHIHGSENAVADALSRIENNALLNNHPPVLDFTAMAKAQAVDPQIHLYSQLNHLHWLLNLFHSLIPLTHFSVMFLQGFSVR